MTGPERIVFVKKLLNLTSDGPIVEWYERLKNFCIKLNVREERICWCKSPENVAVEIIGEVCKHNNENKLKEILNEQNS
jgi:hypothetical protein